MAEDLAAKSMRGLHLHPVEVASSCREEANRLEECREAEDLTALLSKIRRLRLHPVEVASSCHLSASHLEGCRCRADAA